MQEIIINEEWRSIRVHLNYQVSNIGRVRNATSGRIMKLSTNRNGYLHVATSLKGEKTHHEVHRLVALEFIPNPNSKPSVDHIDNNAKLNNTILNLRWATRQEQEANKSKKPNTSSQYKGVSWSKKESKWEAYIKRDRKQMHLGYFKSEEEAGSTYNKKAIDYFGEFAKLNVIEDNQDYPPFGSGSSSGSSTK
jgi:hypothetical protein